LIFVIPSLIPVQPAGHSLLIFVSSNCLNNDTTHRINNGANKGIGFEIAQQLGNQGLHIILSGRNKDGVENAVRKLQLQHISVQPLMLDVADLGSVQAAFKEIAKTINSIDVLVNNAGVLLDESTPLLKVSQGHQYFQRGRYGRRGSEPFSCKRR
jgi:short-subunit dehydrogenase